MIALTKKKAIDTGNIISSGLKYVPRQGIALTKTKAIDTGNKNVVYVRYSEVEDLKRKLSDVSLALSNLETSLSGTELIALRPTAKGLSLQKSTVTKGTKHSEQSCSKILEPGESSSLTGKRLRFFASPSKGWQSGQTRKSRRR